MSDNPDHDALTNLLARFDEYRNSTADRLEKLNELRKEVERDRNAFVRQDIWKEQHRQVLDQQEETTDRLMRLEAWRNRMAGLNAAIGIVAGLAGGVIGAVGYAIVVAIITHAWK